MAIPQKNILKELNMIFNNQPTVLSQIKKERSRKKEERRDDKHKAFRVIMSIGGKVLYVFVVANLILSALPRASESQASFNINYTIDSTNERDYFEFQKDIDEGIDIDELWEILDNNQNLQEDEKEFIKIFFENQIIENEKYINKKQVKDFFKNANIVYKPYKEGDGKITKGGYYRFVGKNKFQIILYGSKPQKEKVTFNDCSKGYFAHECGHGMEKHEFLASQKGELGHILFKNLSGYEKQFLEELVNELFTRDYGRGLDTEIEFDGYNYAMPAMYALADIVDEDALRKYHFNENINYITRNLKKYGIDMQTIFDLYTCLNLSIDLSRKAYSKDATQQDKQNYYDNNSRIVDLIAYMYKTKFGKSMYSDLEIMSCFYETDFADEYFNNQFREKLNQLGIENIKEIVPKAYLSEKAKKRYPYTKIKYTTKDNEEKEFCFDEENKYIEIEREVQSSPMII